MVIALCRKIDALNRVGGVGVGGVVLWFFFFVSVLFFFNLWPREKMRKKVRLKMQFFREVNSFFKLGYSAAVGLCHLPL